jgi:biopolymer transport protein ExbD
MRRPPCHHDQRGRLDVKMTPMIDVIFLLLIFFVCTASFHSPEKVLPTRLSLPGAIHSDVPIDPQQLDLEEIVVEVLWRNVEGRWRAQWQINDRDYTRLAEVRAVLAAVRQLKSDLPVILDVEPDVPMEDVIDVYDLCREVGLERVQFAASAGT